MRSGTLFAYFVTFTASFCMMVIELVAGRILAPYIGQHLYSWTSIIGVCLAGISVGAMLGGVLADKFPRRGTLGWFLFSAGLLSLAIPILADTICNFRIWGDNEISLMWRIVAYTAIIFLPATLVLGMISPMVIKLVVRDLSNAGSVVGRIYAFSTVGSILGTFATGFYLIEEFSTRVLLYGVGALLIILAPLAGGLFYRGTKYVGGALLGLLLAVGIMGFFFPQKYRDKYVATRDYLINTLGKPMYLKFVWPMEDAPFLKESSYYTLRVKPQDGYIDQQTGEARNLNELILDNLIHSHSDLTDPYYLAYDYLRIYEELVGWQLKRKSTTKHNELFIGGGGYTMQRFFHSLYKDSYIDVAEIDPMVTKVAEEYMGAPRGDPRMVTKNEDGRLFVMRKQGANEKYDFIFGDAFNDLSIPFHLTTLEFDQQMKNLLTPNGLVMSLVIDQVGQGLFLPSFIATMRKAFGEENVVLIIIEDPSDRQRMIEYLKKRKMEKYIERLGKETLEDVVKDILIEQLKKDKMDEYADRLSKDSSDLVIRDVLTDYLKKNKLEQQAEKLEKQPWDEVLKDLDSKHKTELINLMRKIAFLKRNKVDESRPYLKATDLDYIPHSTVIVVGSATKQNWEDFEDYVKDMDKKYIEEKSKKRGVSHVVKPAKLTEYLSTRMREPNFVEKLTKGKNRLPWTPVILTDDYAPVDNLTAPVFEKKYGYKKKNASKRSQDEDDFVDDVLEDIK